MSDSFHRDALHSVFREVNRLHHYRMHMLLENEDVYPGQPPLLFSLLGKNGQSQKDLADRLNVKPATITVMLRRMEKSKLVERRQDTEDQRISRVYLTERGGEVCRKLLSIMESIDRECFSGFTEEEKMLLRRLFMQIRDNLARACGKA